MPTWSQVAGTTWGSANTTWGAWEVGGNTPPPPSTHTRIFRPPLEESVPNVEASTRGIVQRFYRHFHYEPRGINVFKLTDGRYTTIEPYNFADEVFQYLGGHVYEVTDAEAAALEAAGYFVEGEPAIGDIWDSLASFTWDDLATNVWNDFA